MNIENTIRDLCGRFSSFSYIFEST